MGNVHFSGQNREVPSYVLNSPKDNVFESHNIRFHIDGHYLTDFSDKGIEKFINKHVNNKSGFLGFIGIGWGGKDLDLKEVKAFIQATAANADKVQGMTFELTDPQLGLFDDDDIKLEDIQHSFNMDYKPVQGTSAGEVSFVDATKVSYDMQSARSTESKAADAYKSAQSSYRDLQKELTSATKERDHIASRLGDSAVKKLAEIDSRINGIDRQLISLKDDMQSARSRLTQDHIPDSERRELKLALRGMEMEQKDLERDRSKLQKELHEHHGFWSFLGGGSTFEDLRKANEAVEKATRALDANRPKLDAAKAALDEARHRREAVEHGASLSELDSAAQPKPATPDDPAGPPAPTEATPAPAEAAASPGDDSRLPAGERYLQTIVGLPAEQQLAAIQQIPEADRQAFLQMADEYLTVGRADNPMGLAPETHKLYADAAEAVGKARLNALLSWGEPAQNAYLERTGDSGARDILAQLDKQLFDQQLAAQAQAFRSRLQSRPQPSEEPVTPTAPTDAVAPQPDAAVTPNPPPAPETTGQPPAPADVAPTPPVSTPGAPEEPVLPGNRTNPLVSNLPREAIGLDAFKALPPEQMLERFVDLPAADQDQVFKGEELNTQGILLMQLASQKIEDEATRERLSQLMDPASKQALVDQLASLKADASGAPSPHLTEVNALLGMFAKQGVLPQAAAPAPASAQVVTEPAPQPVAASAQVVTEPAPQPAAASAQVVTEPAPQPAQPVATKPVTQKPVTQKPVTQKPVTQKPVTQKPVTQKPATPQTPAAAKTGKAPSEAELQWAEALANKIEASQKAGQPYTPTDEEAAKYTDIQTRYAASQELAATQPSVDDMVKSLKGMESFERMQAFNSLTLDGKKSVFPKLPLNMQTECLLSLTYEEGDGADRKALIGSLGASTKQALAKAYNDGLPAAAAVDADLKSKMESLIRELGAKPQAANPASVQPQAQPQTAPLTEQAMPTPQPESQPAPVQGPPAPPSGRLDMSAQLKQLKAVVSERAYWGYGSVTNPQNMNALVEQIWGMGTEANRQEMAKLLVDNKQSPLLAQLLSNQNVESEDVVKTLSAKDFPVKTFMNAVDDSHAFLMLHTFGQVATRNDALGQRAAAMINDTVSAYQRGLDRETPFKRLKQAASSEQFWDKMPKNVRDNIEHMLNSFWN